MLTLCAAAPAACLFLSAGGYVRAIIAALPGRWPSVTIDPSTIVASIIEPVGSAWGALLLTLVTAYTARRSRAMPFFLWIGLLLFCVPAAIYAIGWIGAGKSTLLTEIAGLISPRSGTIQLGSLVLFSKAAGIDLPPYERNVGFVFQDLALWPHLSAIDHIYLVGLGARRPGQLSGGEQQRLAIARTLAGKPSILLIDEPFSSVDRQTKDSLYQLLRQLSPLVPGPTIYVTHHVNDAISLAESVITLEAGKLTPGERPWERRE